MKNFSSSRVSSHSHLQFLIGLYSILLGLTFKSFTGLHQQDQTQQTHQSETAKPNPTNTPIRTWKTKPNKHTTTSSQSQSPPRFAFWVQSEPPPGAWVHCFMLLFWSHWVCCFVILFLISLGVGVSVLIFVFLFLI